MTSPALSPSFPRLLASIAVLLCAVALPASHADASSPNPAPGQCVSAAAAQEYANGTIPLAALCSLWGAPGEYLRADAAYNYNRLSKAYAKRFGSPICVTDSYRSLAAQKSLYKAKPKLAAVPGKSNHGWGVAADLCGGAEKFTSIQHVWLFENAPKYRWVHPTWAQQSGSRPEPWHWEYAPRSQMVRDALGLPPLPGTSSNNGYNGYTGGTHHGKSATRSAMMTSWMASLKE